jgi:insulysin
LFPEDALEGELRAVDSENKKNLQTDLWRIGLLHRPLINPKHPSGKYGTGNWKTLHDVPLSKGISLRDEFIKFYKNHYSENRMKLAIMGRQSLDLLTARLVLLS